MCVCVCVWNPYNNETSAFSLSICTTSSIECKHRYKYYVCTHRQISSYCYIHNVCVVISQCEVEHGQSLLSQAIGVT